METFGRGCLYIIIGFVLIFILAIFVGGITIPWFILIPLIIFAFWIASQKNK
ncbi:MULTISPECIES: hypothetical protein [Paenibacillus]|uniref:hypothetical protein n=1 Tax=Paenibacillus TaxID=44249 RepID=UPI00037B71ED|nr:MULTISPECIES: hypothetical protein [Paenibacillus]